MSEFYVKFGDIEECVLADDANGAAIQFAAEHMIPDVDCLEDLQAQTAVRGIAGFVEGFYEVEPDADQAAEYALEGACIE